MKAAREMRQRNPISVAAECGLASARDVPSVAQQHMTSRRNYLLIQHAKFAFQSCLYQMARNLPFSHVIYHTNRFSSSAYAT